VRDAHKRIDPKLEPITGDPGHFAACLLSTEVRSRVWRGLQEGESPGELRHLVVEDQPVRAHATHRLGSSELAPDELNGQESS
jgi:hypothetical protein